MYQVGNKLIKNTRIANIYASFKNELINTINLNPQDLEIVKEHPLFFKTEKNILEIIDGTNHVKCFKDIYNAMNRFEKSQFRKIYEAAASAPENDEFIKIKKLSNLLEYINENNMFNDDSQDLCFEIITHLFSSRIIIGVTWTYYNDSGHAGYLTCDNYDNASEILEIPEKYDIIDVRIESISKLGAYLLDSGQEELFNVSKYIERNSNGI